MVSHQVKQKQLLKQEKKTYKGDIMIEKALGITNLKIVK